ncbi:hypothetical protein MCERE19_00847 [Spirosomataceae bacterium]|jgi:metal-responsive CopG/Arc/MetJ family transcriptional regulator
MRKSKTLRVRITENQLKRLTDVLIEEELNKSELIREMIDKYVRSCRSPKKKDVVQEINKIKDSSIIIPNTTKKK